MNTSNMFLKWEPLEKLPSELYLEALHDDYEGFRLLLKGSSISDKMLRISFETIFCYRNIDEGDLLCDARNNNYLEDGPWSLFIVENSDYLSWFHNVSSNIREGQNIKHYAIYTPNDCLDILSGHAPEVEFLK